MGLTRQRFYYASFATSKYFGHVAACYEGPFDFADAQESLEQKRGESVVILTVHEIDERQYNALHAQAKRKRRKTLAVVSGDKH